MQTTRWITCCLALPLLALPGLVCSEPETRPGAAGPLELSLELVDERGRKTTDFVSGAPIVLRLELINRAAAAASLQFASTQTHDVVVLRADGSEAWRWSQGRMFAQMLSQLALEPGASRAFEASCRAGPGGTPALAPGRYTAVGIVPALGNELRSAPVAFAVEPAVR